MALIQILGVEELKNYKTLLLQLFAEFLATFLYLSITLFTGSTLAAGQVATALSNGLLIATLIQITGHISGGHINPAVTVGVLTSGNMKLFPALFYILAQTLGSLAGAGVSYALSEEKTRSKLGATIPYKDLVVCQVLGMEILMTFIVVSVVLSVMDTTRNARGLGSASLAIGLSVTACQASCLFYTGSLNPVRSLGPAVMMEAWEHHWAYWVGPLLGGLMAGLINRHLLKIKYDEIVE